MTRIPTKISFLWIVSLLLPFLISCGGGSIGGGDQAPDAVVQDFPIAYVKRSLIVDVAGNLMAQDLRDPAAFNPGAQLILRKSASPSSVEEVLTDILFDAGSSYDVKDLEVSSDGKKLLFALRAPAVENVDIQPTWNIWQYDLDFKQSTRIISSDLMAEQGQDFSPAFLADGRIVFSSTRQRTNKSILLDEGKPQYSGLDENLRTAATVLHVMDADGGNIHQITFNQSHDTDPFVMSDGRIVFTRWDNVANKNGMHLYRVNPDGSHMEFLYGNHSHQTGSNQATIQFTQPREMANGQILTLTRPMVSNNLSGDLTQIDTINFTEINQKINQTTVSTESAQISLTPTDVRNDGAVSRGGYYSSAYPLFDGTNRLLVSWSLCRLAQLDVSNNTIILPCSDANLANPEIFEANPLYGIWMLTLDEKTLLPIVTGDEGFMYTDVVALQPRFSPVFIPDGQAGIDLPQSWVEEGVGVINIRSLYDFDGEDVSGVGPLTLADPLLVSADQRSFRFIRIVKAVSIPDRTLVTLNGASFGRGSGQLMREILGYAPVEPDGSVQVKVPANVAFSIDVLDKNGRGLTARHLNWLQLTPGQQLNCNGCHASNSELPHGRVDAKLFSINQGAATTGLPFNNTDPSLFADAGETMAETWSRINGVRRLTADIEYNDDWTDVDVRPKDDSFGYRYSELNSPPPIATNCLILWSTKCRITINYPTVIQPVWDLSRITLDSDGVTVLEDNTCTSCHNTIDSMGVPQVPAAQLDLTGEPSMDNVDFLTSYRELLFSDNEQEVVNGVLIDRLIPLLDSNGNIVFEVDENGDLILDDAGNPIPVLVTVGVSPALRVWGANQNPRLFDLFEPTGSHSNWLSSAELKLISEWLDIGAQNYNNPFDVPQN